jgi:outer membrane protein assembly factor BamB
MTPAAPNPTSPARSGYHAALITALAAGAFVITLGVMLAVRHVGAATDDLVDSQAIAQKQAELSKVKPADTDAKAKLRQDIRDLDQELRQRQSQRLAFARSGGWMLAAGAVVCLAAAMRAASYRKRRPVRRPGADEASRQLRAARLARGSVAAMAVLLAAGGAALALWCGSLLDRPLDRAAAAAARTYASWEEFGKQWARFRGPGGAGVSAYANVPDDWDGASGRNILWKTEVPLPGYNSPVVWGNRIFLTGANELKNAQGKLYNDRREVFCFDAADGKLLWRQPVESVAGGGTSPELSDNGARFAASTAVADGHAVYALFANGDIGCFDFEGKPLWTRNIGPFDNTYGHSSSLEVYKNLLLVQADHGDTGKIRSALLALNTATGKTVWELRRPVPTSWTTPILIQAAGSVQLVTAAKPWVIAYDVEKGAELWRAKVLGEDIAPSPVFGGGLVFAVSSGAKMNAIRPDGQGDVTDTHVVWQAEGQTEICSPVTDGKNVWMLTSQGRLTCYSAKDGAIVYEKEILPTPPNTTVLFKSSPGLVGNRLYLVEADGHTHILNTADGKEIAKLAMDEPLVTSPAFQDGRIYIRSDKNLIAIGKK